MARPRRAPNQVGASARRHVREARREAHQHALGQDELPQVLGVAREQARGDEEHGAREDGDARGEAPDERCCYRRAHRLERRR